MGLMSASGLVVMVMCAPPAVFFFCDLGDAWPTVFRKELALLAVAQCIATITLPCSFELHFFGDLVKLFLFQLDTFFADQGLPAMLFVIVQLFAVEMLSSEISTTVARACV